MNETTECKGECERTLPLNYLKDCSQCKKLICLNCSESFENPDFKDSEERICLICIKRYEVGSQKLGV